MTKRDEMNWDNYLKVSSLVNGLCALGILATGLVLAHILKQKLEKIFLKHTKDLTVKLFAVKAAYATTLVAIVISALSRLGIPTASLITLLGAASLTSGLAMKDYLTYLIAGLILVTSKPFRIGDSVDVQGVTGVIESINLFTTCIRTETGETWHINNAKIINDKIGVKVVN